MMTASVAGNRSGRSGNIARERSNRSRGAQKSDKERNLSKGSSRPKSNSSRVKKMRKSSLSKVQKNFAVFNDSAEHENKYETLAVAEADEKEVILLDEEEDTAMTTETKGVHAEETANVTGAEGVNAAANALDDNQDFIGFSDSEEEVASGEENGDADYAVEDAEDESSEPLPTNADYPWIQNHDHSRQREIADWLTLEIKDFVSYISPNKTEIQLRNDALKRIRDAVQDFWPDANLHCFGSYATDLYLPGSDIDCVVNSKSGDKDNKNALYSLASYLKRNGLATQVSVIAKARVPIIKFVEPASQIHIDLSFERTNGVEAAKIIRGWLHDTPGLRELVLIVKQFLHARRLNDVHIGGLGGFSIICLAYSFLKLHPRIICRDIEPLQNLGVLLIDFFELYGKNFGYDDVGIAVSEGDASYINKKEYPELTRNLRGTFNLVIQDPGDPANNISRGSFNIRDIKKAFAGAFELLTNRCFELDAATFKHRVGKSILGNVIKYRGAKRDFKDERALIVNKAIQENEEFHQRRGRIVHRDTAEFINISDDDDYELQPPPKRARVPAPAPAPADNVVVLDDPADDYVPAQPVDKLMGLDDTDDYLPAPASPTDTPKLDKAAKRNYWLSKGQTM
ncbi:AEL207Wp [Eremothecium gossypii ATCC 10895]|uniref:Poly(A) RNA polymerase protein 1 n=1 Tax=Eremothecium gossypii (strain ATCC 10895 / CBS 109.51 / FGSC 9923 / NRRL Y-1056) TaxID=284811 RepID=TRF5_EREGS|nr:AEL207Wp [Eremothecium gossypii ATCC 10895]Q9HFW3.1 RecName: Full=Poly(A) RNA polymerase protein 1; AltName: Full=Topoisomerase 1-related protein TRF5 [Eremothecium gossypii ATCC 10895]AAG17722.1 Trf5 [Eremothecium gossypii]AAS52478.1 AEL207Wp [Eremothecium gossypii ATCC 10895]